MFLKSLTSLSLIICNLLFTAAAQKATYLFKPKPCFESESINLEQCGECYESIPCYGLSLQEGDWFLFLHGILSATQDLNSISFDKINDTFLTWSYNGNSSFINMSITLFTWNMNINVGKPLSSCCDIPFAYGGCHVNSCFTRPVYVSFTLDQTHKFRDLRQFSSCVDPRSFVRYFVLCTNRSAMWRESYNCECVVYDSLTGALLPGNFTAPTGVGASDNSIWYTDYQQDKYEVCYFTMPRNDVVRRGEMIDPDNAMDEAVFRRAVYYMRNYTGYNGLVKDLTTNSTVNCTILHYRGTDVFRISSDVVRNETARHDNMTFLCLVMWPNGTDEARAEGVQVKCMPKNESDIYVSEPKNTFVTVMMIVLPVVCLLFFACICCFLLQKTRKNIRKFIKETKTVPPDVDAVVKRSLDPLPGLICNPDFTKEEYDVLDDEEKKRVVHVLKRWSRNDDDFESQICIEMTSPELHRAKTADKRIQRDDEYSDSEDEGEGGRKNEDSHKKKRRKVEGGTNGEKQSAEDSEAAPVDLKSEANSDPQKAAANDGASKPNADEKMNSPPDGAHPNDTTQASTAGAIDKSAADEKMEE